MTDLPLSVWGRVSSAESVSLSYVISRVSPQLINIDDNQITHPADTVKTKRSIARRTVRAAAEFISPTATDRVSISPRRSPVRNGMN